MFQIHHKRKNGWSTCKFWNNLDLPANSLWKSPSSEWVPSIGGQICFVQSPWFWNSGSKYSGVESAKRPFCSHHVWMQKSLLRGTEQARWPTSAPAQSSCAGRSFFFQQTHITALKASTKNWYVIDNMQGIAVISCIIFQLRSLNWGAAKMQLVNWAKMMQKITAISTYYLIYHLLLCSCGDYCFCSISYRGLNFVNFWNFFFWRLGCNISMDSSWYQLFSSSVIFWIGCYWNTFVLYFMSHNLGLIGALGFHLVSRLSDSFWSTCLGTISTWIKTHNCIM